jgi:heme-degrading monooxygenase HmoA
MYARMTVMMIHPDRFDEAVALYKKSVIPAAKKQKGYRGACLLTDIQSGKGISLTFWASEKDAAANEESLYYQEQLAKFLDMLAGSTIREGYDVALHSLFGKIGSRAAKKR